MMADRFRVAVAPVYLFLCLLIGGSSQGVWGNAILRLLAVALIAWAIVDRREERLVRPVKQLLGITGLAILLVVLQLIPLPVAIWTALPGRELVIEGFRLLGIKLAPMPLSLSPNDSLAAMLALLPPLGMIAAMAGLRAYRSDLLAAALIAGTAAGVLLGVLQASSPDPENSFWYLYRHSNFGVATGFFANGNHMADLLLIAIPFIAALGSSVRQGAKDVRLRSATLAMVGGGLAVVILGLILNGSLAGYGLLLPIVLASLLLLFAPRIASARSSLIGIAVVSVAAMALLWLSPVGGRVGTAAAETSVTSRQEILSDSLEMIDRFGLTGSGLGTYQRVYALGEDPAAVDRVFVNHAHNDYAELAVETGLPGVIILLIFLGWWGTSVWRMLKSPAADQYAFAGAIGSAAVLLHSLVDYPLRTAAISTVFAMCLMLIVLSRRAAKGDNDLRPTRHLVVG
ncbi:MAG TPA: O-antigen ligase family protein [Sphingomicrobium sp.]|nr:O-antigen ligase family protein [Sphingomicrobium sp.]